jgi:hypothetical protein
VPIRFHMKIICIWLRLELLHIQKTKKNVISKFQKMFMLYVVLNRNKSNTVTSIHELFIFCCIEKIEKMRSLKNANAIFTSLYTILWLPVLHFSVVILFWSFGIIDASTIKCWELSTAQAGARGREGCSTYSLSLLYRLNQTESAILMYFFLWLMLPRDHFVSRFVLKVKKYKEYFYSSLTCCNYIICYTVIHILRLDETVEGILRNKQNDMVA